MEKQQRIILYGRSLILAAIGASLRLQRQFEVITLAEPYPDTQKLEAMAPDTVVFDLKSQSPEAPFSMLATCPDLQLIGVDADRNQAMLWSRRQLYELSSKDLYDVIRSKNTQSTCLQDMQWE